MVRACFTAIHWRACAAVFVLVLHSAEGAERRTFQKQTLSDRFYSEGASIGDIDGDGAADIVAGPYWYAGPEFTERHAYTEPQEFRIAGYSDNFLSFTHDITGDGRTDILVIPLPGEQGYWYENPGATNGNWPRHRTIDHVDGESPGFVDITGDGEPELVCIYQGGFVYAHPREDDPTKPWKVVRLTPNRGYGRYTHGQGVGDVDGDGRMDLLETNGWWQQPDGWQPGESFRFHPARFADAGGAQMFAYDVDGDGDNDVISSQNAHAYGLSWFEQQMEDGKRRFIEHPIMGDSPDQFDHGVAFSQLHALALADMNGDGIKDIVTGKRYWAHGGKDPGAHGLPVLYWFQIVRGEDGVRFVPHQIDNRSGVGTQVTVGDVDGDEDLDVVVGNKLGVFVLRQNAQARDDKSQDDKTQDEAETSQQSGGKARANRTDLEIGGDAFAAHVRPTEHLSPEQEQRRFVLPSGFEIQLVAAEPQIAKPLNMAFDGRGRLWVTDTVEYPYAAPRDREGRDTIKILEDTDGDGRADKVKTFADNLNIPMGLYPYLDGVICFGIPNIWFLRDIDGDDVADERTVLYGPMGYERDVHGLCNAFRRGFDGWLYACHGFNNHTEVQGKDGHTISMQSGNTFRMRLDGQRIEHYTWGQVNPFGMAFDRTGNIFTADCHTKPVTLLLQGGYYESFGKPHDGLGFVPPVMHHLHGSTAIGGIALYDGDNFPVAYHGSTFGGNVMTSRVNRNTLTYEGGSVRAQEEPDFVISGDPWFRPVDLRVGPDGALYIADFYNKIIGHYEVPLDHPGRDRTSGRIWRVVYRGSQRPPAKNLNETDLTDKSVGELIALLDSANLAQRMLISDRLVDHFATAAVAPAKEAFDGSDVPNTRVHAMWILFRLRALDHERLAAALADENPLVRIHALRVLRETDAVPRERAAHWVRRGLDDDDSRVRRAAAMAATRVPDERLIEPLINAFFATPASDVHLRHAIRMALRDYLRRDAWLDLAADGSVEETVDETRGGLIADICLALDSPAAAEYVLDYVQQHPVKDRERLIRYVGYVAGRIKKSGLATVASLAQERFADEREIQLQLIDAVRRGLETRGEPLVEPVQQWALKLARPLLHLESLGRAAVAWSYSPLPGVPARGNPWVVQPRPSADGVRDALFYCSLPNGEPWTGTLRSSPFALPEKLSFYLAGHAGFPANPAHHKNLVRLRDAVTDEVLLECIPPRNDTAQRIDWDTSPWSGRSAILELVDGDTGSAYAWLAVGRFSVTALNPTQVPPDRRAAADLIAKFKLADLRDELGKVLRESREDALTCQSLAEGMVALSPDTRLLALCEAFGIEACPRELRCRIVESVIAGDARAADELLAELMAVAAAPEQLRIAQQLSQDAEGMAAIVRLIGAGRASPRLLHQPSIAPRIEALSADHVRQQALKLAKSAAPLEEALARLVQRRKAEFSTASTDPAAGAAVFREQCANCHKLAGEGKTVGPQLDGIGNRGPERILEDVLDPNRNVDVAFRTTTITTASGRIVSGILLREEGENLVLADQEGKEFTIAKVEVDEQHPSRLSLMPANFGELLSKQQLFDLAAFLAAER